MTRRRTANEHGVVAVVVAIAALLIFGVCAFAVDFGNAYARKRDIQTQADLAALAAAAQLPRTTTNSASIIAAADAFAEENAVWGQDLSAWDFADTDTEDGWLEFVGANKLRVHAPYAHVSFTLAQAIGFTGLDVNAVAAVEIRSPGLGPVPFYAVEGCNLGLQTISEDQADDVETGSIPVPSGMPGTDDPSKSTVTGIDTNPATNPDQIPVDATGSAVEPLTISGTDFSGDQNGKPIVVKNVGFFHESTPGTAIMATATVSVDSATKLALSDVPHTVSGVPGIWFVRVLVESRQNSDIKERWTAPTGNAVLQVVPPGPAPTPGWTECPDGASEGNFGSLDLPRTQYNGKFIQANIAKSLDPQLSLEIYPGPYGSDWVCDPGEGAPTVTSTGQNDIKKQTNCVNVKTGFPGSEATQGFISGLNDNSAGDFDGRLAKDSTTDPDGSGGTCAPNGTDTRVATGVPQRTGSGTVSINNDVLSCFITNSTTTVGELAQPDASFPASAKQSLSSDIFLSPRFLWVPIFGKDPSQGNGWYKLIGFQPGFLTDQPATATRSNRALGPSTQNGLRYTTNGKALKSIKVLFFNDLALPDTAAANGPSFEYLGVGTKIPTLVE